MERQYKWRFSGGGILHLDGQEIWPGKTFIAIPSRIPEEFRERVVKIGPARPPSSGKKKEATAVAGAPAAVTA